MAKSHPGPAPKRHDPDQPHLAPRERPSLAPPGAPRVEQEMRRLLHEAAWRRMFGQAGTRNPFSRRAG